MAGRGNERFEKRQRERARQQKAAAKRERRADKKTGDEEDGEPGPTEDELLEKVRILNEQHAEGLVDDETFEERRTELFEQLGLA